MQTVNRRGARRIKHIVFFLSALFSLASAFGQAHSHTNHGKGHSNHTGGHTHGHNHNGHGTGGGSDDCLALASGLIFSDNEAASTMLTPTGWGSTQSFAFVSASGTPNQLYSNKPDMGLRAGFGLGDSRKVVSLVGMVNVYDASSLARIKLRDVTYSFIASRSLGKWGSISVGSLNNFADTSATDGVHSYFGAYSWAPRGLKEVTPGNPRLSFTVGVGSGKFLFKTEADMQSGRGSRGTGVFASVSYDLVKNFALNAEWTGVNLGLTTAYRLPNKMTIFAGVAQLTRVSGDAPTFVFGVGKALGF